MARSRDRGKKRPGASTPSDSKLPPLDEPEVPAFSLTLRDVEIPPLPEVADTGAGEELVRSDPEARREPWLGDPQAERTEHRDARRAQVRRDRLRDAPDGAAAAPAAAQLLVLGADARTDTPLCELLSAFGFAVQALQSLPELAAPWPFMAVLVDLTRGVAGGGDGIELCNDVRERSRLPGTLKPVLMLVAEQLGATDRVRAGLAGCNEVLLGPLARGSVARALEARGIALPSDARRV